MDFSPSSYKTVGVVWVVVVVVAVVVEHYISSSSCDSGSNMQFIHLFVYLATTDLLFTDTWGEDQTRVTLSGLIKWQHIYIYIYIYIIYIYIYMLQLICIIR